jgi:hypothetical protein
MTWTFALWKTRNPLYRFAEHTFVAVSIGHAVVLAIQYINGSALIPALKGEYIYIFVMLLGLMLYLRFSKKYFYICRWPLSFMVGIGLGLTLRGWTHGWLVDGVIKPTILPLFVGGSPIGTFNNIITVIMTLTVLSYFIFSIEHKGILGHSARIGRYFMMIMFGVMFSNITFSRLASLSGVIRTIVETFRTLFA